MYLTGGIGSSGDNEGFTKDFDLPNKDAYCETCASVGMVLWNERMTALTGDAKYMDVLERSLYNGALDGLSLSGDLFFMITRLHQMVMMSAANGLEPLVARQIFQGLLQALADIFMARMITAFG